jgi:hypothetical protein
MYDAISADFIFRAIATIESFQGAMAASWKLSSKGRVNLQKIFSILVNPKGHRKLIIGFLKKRPFSEETICRLFGFPLLTQLDMQITQDLRNLLKDVFIRLEATAWYSQRFLDEYRDIRNAYAHNYHFIFFQEYVPITKTGYDESILGFLKDSDSIIGGMAYLGAKQRQVMGKLVFILSNLERWIYKNLKVTILNNCRHVLPPGIPYLDEEQRREYESIWKSQGYNYYGAPTYVDRKMNVEHQIDLVDEFFSVLQSWGYSFKVYSKDRKEFEFLDDK